MLMISVVNAGERPKVYFRFKEIPTVPPSPKFEAKTKELTPIAIKKIVNRHDENAFLVIHDVRDVLGNGFMKLQ